MRSKSFSSASAKQKVKRIDEVVPQKHKSNRDNASLGTKGGGSRTMGKSMSFHAFNSGGSNSTDLKAKMFSPKCSHGQDIKGQNTKERSLVERKNSLRLERPLVNSVVTTSTTSSPEVDNNLPVRDETGPFCSTSNNRDLKSAQSDNKLIQVSRPVNKAISNGSDVPVLSGIILCCIFILLSNIHYTCLKVNNSCVYMLICTQNYIFKLSIISFPLFIL